MPPTPPLPPVINPQRAPAWFAGKTVEDLDAFEAGRRVLIPEKIRWVGAKGEEREEAVLVVVPTEQERALARADAVAHVATIRKKAMGSPDSWTVARAQELVGADVFENFDTFAIVARATREPKQTSEQVAAGALPTQFMLLALLIDSYPPSALFDLFERIDFYSKLYNPRLSDLSQEEFWGAVANIARVRNVSPLGGMRGDTQSAFIVAMASELWSYRIHSSSSPSTETSTPE